jgi:putative membrane protein
MSKIIYASIILIVIVLGVIFAVLNAEPVQLNYYFDSLSMPLSLAMIVSMFIGAVLGVLASIGVIFKCRKEMTRLRKAAEVADKEIANLRAIPIKNQH